MARPRLFLIDTFGFLFRAFHARARSGAPPMRTSSGTPTEVVFIFNNMLKKLKAEHKPEYLAAVFESEGPTQREQEFSAYKANRPPTPPDFLQQIPHVRRLLEAMKVPTIEYPGFEADDVIGTMARSSDKLGVDVVIVSSDKDMLQLVNEHVSMLNPAKDDEWYDPAKVKEYMGVAPEQVADLLALRGDAVDNIPGAPGIGEKGARDLIEQYGSIEAALERAAEVQRKTYRESLQNHREQIELSKRLATIASELPIEWRIEEFTSQAGDEEALRRVYSELEFFSQLKDLKGAPPAEAWAVREVDSEPEFEAWVAGLKPGDVVAVAFSQTGEGLLAETRVGLSVADREGIGVSAGMGRQLLADATHPKQAHDGKTVLRELAGHGIELAGLADDTMLYEFLLGADPGGCAWEVVSQKHLDRSTSATAGEMAAGVRMVSSKLKAEVERRGLMKVYREIDLPLVPVLARMEEAGVRIDRAALQALSTEMEAELERLTALIHKEAGHPFNISSPQQLAKVLFEEMKLAMPNVRGKGKQPSTAADVLESLAEAHVIARLTLDYRQAAKLKNTYADTLPRQMDSGGRVHTSFNAAGAATGRLSSSNPNLQNIPIRTEMGRKIRAAFVPEPGWKLVVADYSQIELRLLAHLSGDPVLIEAFQRGEDIHARTAAEVFGVMPAMVTPEMRRSAKAVNFGIVYGLSGFGLAQQLGIPRHEAERYIRNYFERYSRVKGFIEETLDQVRRDGHTTTLFGRQRPIPDIHSRNPNARGFAERTAVNTPLQGTAADMIKVAMIRIDEAMKRQGMRARMLLQVHDELVFEAPAEEAGELGSMARKEMEGVVGLAAPLVVDVGTGDNWRDAK